MTLIKNSLIISKKKFDELIGYKGEIKEFAEKFNLNWGTTYYLSDFKQNCCCGEDVEPKFPEKYREFEPCLAHIRISYCFYINTHFSGLRDKVTRKEFLPLFIAWHDKHFDEINNRIKLFNKIYNEVMMVFNTLKKANDVLDKFGFIKSINLYINDLLSQNVHPISCVTEDVEKSVDNYLSQRKTLDDTEN